MSPEHLAIGFLAVSATAFVVMRIGAGFPDMFKDKTRFNSTDDWTAAPEYEQETPTGTCLAPYELRLITSYLEAGEALEGFTRGFFVPPRSKDWKFGSGLERLSLLVAATSRRRLRRRGLRRSQFPRSPHGGIWSVRPTVDRCE